MTIARNWTRINRKHLQITWEYCGKYYGNLVLDEVLFKGKMYRMAIVFEDSIWFYDKYFDVIRKLKGHYKFLFVNITSNYVFTTRTYLREQDALIEQSIHERFLVTKVGRYFRLKYFN